MKTYQDLLNVGEDEKERMGFLLAAIKEHQSSIKYRIAEDAEMYYKNLNPTIMRLQKFIRNQMGQSVPDTFSPNNKIPSNLYHYFVTQEVETLLGNGATFEKDDTKDKLGKNFDQRLQECAKHAINGSAAYGFWNFDHIEVFNYLEFVPLYDEYTGELMAGIRYWQIDNTKPLCVALFEPDGLTEYVREKGKDMAIRVPKRAYKAIKIRSEAEGELVTSGGNYETLPVVPLYNEDKQSAIIGKQNTLDAYDLTLSQMVNNVDDGNFIYWILKNCGGMDAIDDERFISQLKITHMAHADGDSGAGVEAHTVEAPYAANNVTLENLRRQLFDDFMALDTKEIAGGAVTATQIQAAYEPLNSKCDQFEFNVIDFVNRILALAGIDDEVSFVRSKIVNNNEEIQNVLASAEYLDSGYITKRILTLMGDPDKFQEVMDNLIAEDAARFNAEGEVVIDESGKQNS
jgi:hypothetical protein